MAITQQNIEPLMTIHDLAAFLQRPVKTLYQWRTLGYGPPAYRVGRELRYDQAAVAAWLATVQEAVAGE